MFLKSFIPLSLLLLVLSVHAGWGEAVTPENVFQYTQTIVNEVVKEYPQLAAAYVAQGYMFHRAKKFEDALRAFEKSIELDPKQPLPTQMVAFIYNQLAQYEKAVEWYQKALKIDPKAPQANERLGLALQRLNRMDEAMKAFEQEVQYYPSDASAHVYLGERYLDAEKLKEAEEQAKLAMKYDTLLPEPYYLLARIYRKQGLADQSKKILDTFKQKKKEEQDFIEANSVEETDQEKAIKTAAETHNETGTIYYHNNQLEKAESHFKRAIEIDPKNTEARYNLTTIYQQKNELDKAVHIYQELLAIEPNDPRYLLGLGLIRLAQQQYAEAQTLVEKVLSIAPTNLSAQRTLARILLSNGQNPSKAIQLLETVIKNDANAIDYDLLGWAYYASGNIDKSLDALRAAMKMDPTNPTYQKRYDKIMAKLNQK